MAVTDLVQRADTPSDIQKHLLKLCIAQLPVQRNTPCPLSFLSEIRDDL